MPFQGFFSRLSGALRAEQHYADLDEELRFHIDERTEELMAEGMPREKARREALRRFGHYGSQREAVRDVDVFRSVEAFAYDLRYGARQLRMNPGFAVVAILSLALGIGANSAIFQLIHALQLRPLPVEGHRQLVSLERGSEDFLASGFYAGRTTAFTFAQFEELERSQEVFSSMLGFATSRFNISPGGEGKFAAGLFVTENFFRDLGVEPMIGSGFAPQAGPRDCSQAGVVVSHRFWQRELGADAQVLQRELLVEGLKLPVVGVAPPGFFGLETARHFDLAVPLCVDTLMAGDFGGRLDKKDAWWLVVIGRLKPGFTVEQAASHVRDLSPGIFRATVPTTYRPEEAKEYSENMLTVESAWAGVSSVREEYQNPLWILLASTGLVLILACANLANLLLARASVREREISLRQAVGASRLRLVAQLMTESLLLALSGAVLGGFIAQVLSRGLALFLDPAGTMNIRLGVHWQVVGFTTLLATGTCLLFGLMPALRASRSSPVDAMRGGRGVGSASHRHGLRRALVVLQIALSLVLLVGALLFGQSLRNLLDSGTGLDTEGVLLAQVQAPTVPADRRSEVFRDLEQRFNGLAEVSSAGAVIFSPFAGTGWNQSTYFREIENSTTAWFNRVGPEYFSTVKMPLLSGRAFGPQDSVTGPPVAIINQRLARELFGDVNPVGQQLRYEANAGEEDPSYEVIGVVADSKYYGLRDEIRPFAYLPTSQEEKSQMPFMGYLLRLRGPVASVKSGIQEQMALVDGGLLVEYRMMDAMVERTVRLEKLMANLSAGFGVLAALLSALGLYGVMSYLVACRRREMGVRLALGGGPMHIVGLVASEAGRLVAVGLVLGVAGALALARFAEVLLFGLAPNDPWTLVVGSLLLTLSAAVAISVPLRRAARCDPAEVLRSE
ncbi:MAG: ABC transporter permease [Acidobacteriota bacterium]